MRLHYVWLTVVLGLCGVDPAGAQRYTFRGEAATTLTVSDAAPRSSYLSARYTPELFAEVDREGGVTLDALASLDASGVVRLVSFSDTESDGDVDLYRLWFRYGANQFESRLGLQKISFGSASLLRPLMWFDRIDPRDPLQVTEGVYALLTRYYFLNNANLWFWGLIGNDETKGWEVQPSSSEDPEFGGRFQTPAGPGEIAFSYHHRKAELGMFVPPGTPKRESTFRENRFALDGKWDLTVGLWFEASLIHQQSKILPRDYTRLGVVGCDYTFGLGDGLTILGEHFRIDTSEQAFDSGDGASTSAFSARYRWGVVDELSAILYYDWEQEALLRFATWRRGYDRWAIQLIVFANPSESQSTPVQSRSDLLAGSGAQVLISLNH